MNYENNTKNPDTMTETLKDEIKRQFPSVRAFAKECGVPHGTIVSALNNGIEGTAWGTVKKICDCLHIDCGTFEPILEEDRNLEQESRVLAYFSKLSERGKNKAIEYMKDIMQV